MNTNSDSLDKKLIKSYQDQRPPEDMHDAIMQSFLLEKTQFPRQSRSFVWKTAAVAAVIIVVIGSNGLLNRNKMTPSVASSSIRLSISTAKLQPLPSLSSVRASSRHVAVTLSTHKPSALMNQFRKTLNATNKFL